MPSSGARLAGSGAVAAAVALVTAIALAALGACQLALPFDHFDEGRGDAATASSGDGGVTDAGSPCLLASGRPASPAEIVVDDTYAYWVEFDDEAGVYRVPKDDCSGDAAVQALATNLPYPADLAIDDDYVYWVNESVDVGAGGGSVMKVAKSGGAPVTLATSLSLPNRIVLDDTSAYFTEQVPMGTISSVPKDGGAARTVNVANLAAPGGLAVDATNLYFTTAGVAATTGDKMVTGAGVWRAPKSCPSPTTCATVLTSSIADPFVLRLSGGLLFFSQHASGTTMPGSVYVLAADAMPGTVPGELNPTEFTAERLGVAVDGFNVYVAADATPGGSVSEDSFALVGAAVSRQNSRVIAGGLEAPQGITLDTSYVYFTTFYGGQIWRAPR